MEAKKFNKDYADLVRRNFIDSKLQDKKAGIK
jgi:hypothetical protein